MGDNRVAVSRGVAGWAEWMADKWRGGMVAGGAEPVWTERPRYAAGRFAARRRGARSIAPEGEFLIGSHYLHVADDRPVGVVDELDADLRHVTGVTGAPEDAVNLSELDWLIHVDWACKIEWRGGAAAVAKATSGEGEGVKLRLGRRTWQ